MAATFRAEKQDLAPKGSGGYRGRGSRSDLLVKLRRLGVASVQEVKYLETIYCGGQREEGELRSALGRFRGKSSAAQPRTTVTAAEERKAKAFKQQVQRLSALELPSVASAEALKKRVDSLKEMDLPAVVKKADSIRRSVDKLAALNLPDAATVAADLEPKDPVEIDALKAEVAELAETVTELKQTLHFLIQKLAATQLGYTPGPTWVIAEPEDAGAEPDKATEG